MIGLLWGAIVAITIGIIMLMVTISRLNREWADLGKRDYNIKLVQLAVAIVFIALVLMTAYIVSYYSNKKDNSEEYAELARVPRKRSYELHGTLPAPALPRRVVTPSD